MDSHAQQQVYLHLCSDGAGVRIATVGAVEAAVEWTATARPQEIDDALVELVRRLETRTVLAWDYQMPASLLSRDGVAEATASLRARLHDVLAAALIVTPGLRDYSLSAVTRALGVADEDEVPELIDDPRLGAELCHAVAVEVSEQLPRLPPGVMALVRELVGADAEFAWLPWERVEMPALDGGALEMLLAGRPVMPQARRRERITLDEPLPEMAARLLEAAGPVAAALARYEHRPGQIEMAEAVGEALLDGELMMVEAGTGVGKSLAYLVPAILWALTNAEPVIVSTNTKNLQEQLLNKDLPLLAGCLDMDFRSALLKGRSNYVCVRRFMNAIRDVIGSMMPDDRRAAAYLVSWFAESESCDLDLMPPEAMRVFRGLGQLIDRVRSDRASCLGPSCQYARRCPMRVARATARNSDIVVSNHALTLADTRFDVLPTSSRIIFDEAHNLEAVATDQLGHEVSNFSFQEMRRTFGGDGRRRGLADGLADYLAGADPHRAGEISEARQRLLVALDGLAAVGEGLGGAVIDLCVALDPEAGTGRARVRLGPQVYASPQWQQVGEAVEDARRILDTAEDALGEIAEALGEGAERRSPESDLALEAAGARAAVVELCSALGTLMDDEAGAGYVLWAETVRRRWGEFWRLCAAPIDVGPALQRAVYDQHSAVVMTSATLTVDGTFEYMRQRLGLFDGETQVREEIVPSPFSYPEQLLMCVPADIPTRGEHGRSEALIEALLEIAQVAMGGVLLLFTSRNQMERVFDETWQRLVAMGLSPVCQHRSGPRTWLLQQLRERDNTVLFGLKSFWEGVDVPGQALRCVVIVKLPFAVPTDPIVEARCELAASRGLDGGYDYYIPEAILGFKQGTGRLVRSTTDQGVVFVLDNRLLTRSYGRRFFASIPDCRYQVGDFDECLREADRWLKRG